MKAKRVVVTTEYRGVFFGTLKSKNQEKRVVVLTNARNCLYWHDSVKGFIGLAVTGPSKQCRIGPAVSTIELAGVTAVLDCSEGASKKWEDAPWS